MPPQASTPTPTEQFSRTPTLTPTPISGVYCTDSGSGGTEIIPIEPPRAVARIRIDMVERATEHGNSLWEVEAYGPETGDTNLVIGGTADASTVQSGVGCEECFAYKAVDGDTTTRWSSDWEDPQWLEIALPTPQVVNRIVLKWEQAFAEEYCVTVAQVTVVLSDFETDVQSWQPAEGDREVATGIDWADGALRCDFIFAPPYAESPHASYCLEVSAPMRDWTRFVKLMFEAKSLVNPSFQMKATISLATGSDYCWNELGDFQPVGQQWKTLILELDQAKYKVCPDFINYTENLNNKDDVRQLCVVVVADGGEPEGSILIDNVRLVGE